MAKRMIIKGVGMFMAKRVGSYGEEVVTLGTLQDLKIDLSVEIEDIFGGDGMFAIDTLVKSKNIEVTATDAKLDLNAISLMLGSTISPDSSDYLWVLGENKALEAAAGGTNELCTVTVSSGATANGTLSIMLDGAQQDVTVNGGWSKEQVAAALMGKIALLPTGAAPFKYRVLQGATSGEFSVEARVAGPVVDASSTNPTGNVALSGGATGVDYTVTTSVQGAATYASSEAMSFPVFASSSTDVSLLNPEFAVRVKDTNTTLTRVYPMTGWAPANATSLSDTSFVYYDTDKKIYTNGTHAGKTISVNYKRAETVDVLAIKADEIPFPVSVIHHGSFMQKDGTFQGIETELFACTAKGTYSINAQRATASANTVTLAIVDPERADGRIGTIKRYSASSKV